MINGQRFLVVYSGALTAVVLAAVAMGFAPQQSTTFDEITVHRINVVEPDGTLRMVISNHARLPGVIVQGNEQPPHDRPQAGMIFYNDEGSENGGLIFGGHRDAEGKITDSGGSLTFDRYGADQIVQLVGVDDKTDKFAGVAVNDSSSKETLQRIWMGRGADGTAMLSLADAKGNKRLVLQVAADGQASVAVYDANGKLVKQLAPQ